MTTTKYSQESYKFYLRKRGIDWDDFRQECALVELQHPNWQDDKIARTALKQCSRAISGNRRKRVESSTLVDQRDTPPIVAEDHPQISKFWNRLPNGTLGEVVKQELDLAMQDQTHSLPNWVKRIAKSTLESCAVLDAMFQQGDVWAMFINELNRVRIPIRHRVKFMTKAELASELASYPPVTARDHYDAITHKRSK